ncbi:MULTISPECIES: hypothetical protein [unclassified Rathayibacter]|uniref:hypothetical protein n=1 Tax=unclassified Rathayibacter TaxID=2609250 RepID=UPI000CE8488C|nr:MULTISPECIES: hypothetical protein [unclassified Rathayibacter]PPH01293.1 hypothetical protein C5C33_16585 [Rathayibacter sp. AY1H3]PPH16844.1 hypothetical protein C5C35_08990 [Rathayibacter sp. AY1F8]PPH70873.1 hypothetical protein C5C90_16085 [Rathayibacter sp. AY1D4]PPH88131.1 hypothetical protein C5C64_12200 [Rathayibacter sp. AY1D3]
MPSRSARTTGIVLAALGLVAVVLAIVLLVRPAGGGAPGAATASAGPSSAPSGTAPATSAAPGSAEAADGAAAPAPTVSAAPSGTEPGTGSDAPPAIVSFASTPASVDCEGDRTASVPLALSWETSGGATARLAVGTTDASAGEPVDLAASGYTAVTADCRDSETLITLAVLAPDGTTAQRTLVVPAS